MDRTAALTYISDEYTAIAIEAGVTLTDTGPGFKSAIDNALRELLFAETDLATADVPEGQAKDYVNLLDYFALKKLAQALAIYADVRVDAPGVEKKKSQIYANVVKLLTAAQDGVEQLGYLGSRLSNGFVNFDYIEPKVYNR